MAPQPGDPSSSQHPEPRSARDQALRGAAADPREIRARRRAVRGISLSLIALGILLAAGLSTLGGTPLSALGLLPAVLGGSGFLAVSLGVPASLRLPARGPARRGRALWLLPAGILVLAIAFLAAAFWADGAAPESGSPWTIVWLVSAATMVTFAGLGFGLVAASRLTAHDDDDAPLRAVDWAEEYPQRYPQRRTGQGRDLYDSSWIHGDR